jgi:hypothetical protein
MLLMLSDTNKPFVLSVGMLIVVMLSVVVLECLGNLNSAQE